MRSWIIRKAQGAWASLKDRAIKKVLLKRAADALEKLGIGSALVGIFQNVAIGIYLGVTCMVVSFIFSVLEAKK